jgi:hypothetical protein
LLFPACSLGDKFTPVAAYAPTGPDVPAARVYEEPVELTMKLLNKVDPFVDMVSPLCLIKVSLALVSFPGLCYPHGTFNSINRKKGSSALLLLTGLALIIVGGLLHVPFAGNLLSMMATSTCA